MVDFAFSQAGRVATCTAIIILGTGADALAFDQKQCTHFWNIANVWMTPVKQRLSNEFKQSMKAAFFVVGDDGSLKLDSAGKPIGNCDRTSANYVRQVSIKVLDDMVVWDLIEDTAAAAKIPLQGNIKAFVIPGAEQNVLKAMTLNRRPVAVQQP